MSSREYSWILLIYLLAEKLEKFKTELREAEDDLVKAHAGIVTNFLALFCSPFRFPSCYFWYYELYFSCSI